MMSFNQYSQLQKWLNMKVVWEFFQRQTRSNAC